MLKLNKINVNEILDNDGWYKLSEGDYNKFNKEGYYKIKCKGDIGVKDGYEYIRI